MYTEDSRIRFYRRPSFSFLFLSLRVFFPCLLGSDIPCFAYGVKIKTIHSQVSLRNITNCVKGKTINTAFLNEQTNTLCRNDMCCMCIPPASWRTKERESHLCQSCSSVSSLLYRIIPPHRIHPSALFSSP